MVVDLNQLGAALRLTDGLSEPAEPIRSILSRYIGVAEAMVDLIAPDAPEAIQGEAVIRMAGYLYDSPPASAGQGFADAWRNSGAASLVARWQVLRIVTAEVSQVAQAIANSAGVDVEAVLALISSWAHQGNTDQIPASKLHLAAGGGGGVFNDTADLLVERLGTIDNPTLEAGRVWLDTGIEIPAEVHVLMIDAGQVSDDYHLVDWDAIRDHLDVVEGAVSMPGDFETFAGDAFTVLRIGHNADQHLLIANEGTDAINLLHVHVERLLAPINTINVGVDDTAVQALIDTHAAISEVHHRRSSSAGIVNVEDGRLASNSGTVMRIGWSESQTYDEAIFTRDGNHPDDGASVGTIAGVFPPVQPTLPAIPDVAANEKYLHIWVGEIPGNIAQLTFFGSPAHGMSAAEAQTYNTTDGTWWRTNLPLSPGISAYAFSATVVGVLIASRTYVDEAIAAIPASTGGGFPTTRTSILSATMTSTNVAQTLSEAFLPNQLYELTINSFTKYIILSPPSSTFRIIMPVPDEVGTDRFEPIFLFIQGSIGSTSLNQFNLQKSNAQSAPVVIYKLT